MMSSNRMMNTNAMAPPTELDFAFAPMQPYMGFDAAMTMPSGGVERPLLQQQHNLYDNLDFAAGAATAGFQFQDSASPFPGAAAPTSLPLAPLPPSMTMAMPSSLQMPMVTLPGVPTAEVYHPFGGGFLKREDGSVVVDGGGGGGGGRIGLNLGRRTYFSPADVLAVDRLLTRSRLGGGGGFGMGMGVLGLGLGAAHHHQPPRCQAEGCKADLSAAKHYHRRHKVCEYHAKAAAVAAGGKQQRFCQQCSRFHVLAEFDEAKRSCRKRLTEHNRRRRKPAGAQGKDTSPPPKKADTSITTSYNSDHKSATTTAGAARSTAISPNGSGVSCLDMAAAAAAPTALSLAALPLREKDGGGGLDSMLIMPQQVQGGGSGRDDDDDEQRYMSSLMLQAAQQQHGGGGRGGDILSCTSASDHQQSSSCCNGFFEVDFI